MLLVLLVCLCKSFQRTLSSYNLNTNLTRLAWGLVRSRKRMQRYNKKSYRASVSRKKIKKNCFLAHNWDKSSKTGIFSQILEMFSPNEAIELFYQNYYMVAEDEDTTTYRFQIDHSKYRISQLKVLIACTFFSICAEIRQ